MTRFGHFVKRFLLQACTQLKLWMMSHSPCSLIHWSEQNQLGSFLMTSHLKVNTHARWSELLGLHEPGMVDLREWLSEKTERKAGFLLDQVIHRQQALTSPIKQRHTPEEPNHENATEILAIKKMAPPVRTFSLFFINRTCMCYPGGEICCLWHHRENIFFFFFKCVVVPSRFLGIF